MTKTNNRVIVDYFLSPEEIDKMKNEAKKPKFILPLSESSETIAALLKRVASIYARFGVKTEEKVEKRYEAYLNYFSKSVFENAVMSINKEIFTKYNDKSRMVSISPPKNLGGIESVLLKKALNKKGWLVQQTSYISGKLSFNSDWNYVLAPRKKELKTELNHNVKNMELAIDMMSEKCYFDLPLAGFYRSGSNHKEK